MSVAVYRRPWFRLQRHLTMLPTSAVAIIVDPEFGDRLDQIAARMPVWIADTPVNRASVDRNWAARPPSPKGVTIFRVDNSSTHADWLITVLPTVDLHHGEYSQHPPYTVVEVFGAAPIEPVQQAFEEFGFSTFTHRPHGFVATRVLQTADLNNGKGR